MVPSTPQLVFDRWQRPLVDAEQLQQLVIPAATVDVEQHCARSVGRVGRELAGQLEDQPCVDRSEHRARLPQPVHVVQQPLDLCAGEIRIEHQPRPLAHQRLVTLIPQLGAASRGASVLPHDCPVKRLPGLTVPHAHGLALVGDAERLELTRLDACIVERLTRHRARDLPDLARIVLDPARAGEVLLELPVGAPDQLRLLVEREAGRAGRALVDREDHGGNLSGGENRAAV